MDEKRSNAINACENFIRIEHFLAQIYKKPKCLGSYMCNIELSQTFASDLNEKHHQVVLLVRKAENKHENENIFTGELLPGVPGVSRNQKLSTKYEFCSLKVSLEVLIE